jgi:hypothetical protein
VRAGCAILRASQSFQSLECLFLQRARRGAVVAGEPRELAASRLRSIERMIDVEITGKLLARNRGIIGEYQGDYLAEQGNYSSPRWRSKTGRSGGSGTPREVGERRNGRKRRGRRARRVHPIAVMQSLLEGCEMYGSVSRRRLRPCADCRAPSFGLVIRKSVVNWRPPLSRAVQSRHDNALHFVESPLYLASKLVSTSD